MVNWDLIPRISMKLLNYKDKIPRGTLEAIGLAYIGRNEMQLVEELLTAISTLVKQGVDDRELYELVEKAVKLD
jgi:hypothetical protein